MPRPITRTPRFSITFVIDGFPYSFQRSSSPNSFLLTRIDTGSTYTVSFDPTLPLTEESSYFCTCPDHLQRNSNCKHISCVHRLINAISSAILAPAS